MSITDTNFNISLKLNPKQGLSEMDTPLYCREMRHYFQNRHIPISNNCFVRKTYETVDEIRWQLSCPKSDNFAVWETIQLA